MDASFSLLSAVFGAHPARLALLEVKIIEKKEGYYNDKRDG